MAVTTVAAVEQHRGAPFGGGELEPPRRRLVSRLHLGDDAGERPVAQRVLAQGKQLAVVLALRIEDTPRPEPGLFESRGIKVEACQRPEHRKTRRRREARGDPRREKRCRCIVAPACRGSRDLMQSRAVEPAGAQQMIDRSHAERQYRSACRGDARHGLAKRLKLLGARPGR